MKTKILILVTLFLAFSNVNKVQAEDEERNVPSFSEISLRIPGKLYAEQGKSQSVEIVAKSSVLDEIITEVKDVMVRTAGSGNATVFTNGLLKARVAGSGNVFYKGNPNIDTSVAGSGKIKKL